MKKKGLKHNINLAPTAIFLKKKKEKKSSVALKCNVCIQVLSPVIFSSLQSSCDIWTTSVETVIKALDALSTKIKYYFLTDVALWQLADSLFPIHSLYPLIPAQGHTDLSQHALDQGLHKQLFFSRQGENESKTNSLWCLHTNRGFLFYFSQTKYVIL